MPQWRLKFLFISVITHDRRVGRESLLSAENDREKFEVLRLVYKELY